MAGTALRTIETVLLALGLAAGAWAADYPPLCVEIGSEHPLFIFEVTQADAAGSAGYAQRAVQAWTDLPYELKPCSALQVDVAGADVPSRHQAARELLEGLQAAGVPVVFRLADENPRKVYPLELAEELLNDFTCIKGIQAVGFAFDEYGTFGDHDPMGTPPHVRWLTGAIDMAARYGRFAAIELGQLGWPRVMTNTACRPLYEQMRACRDYVLPINVYRGPHNVAGQSASMGLWLEGGTARWGVGPCSWWYSDAHFIEPGVYGLSEQPVKMPPALYRAMILNGAMGGATVYSFSPDTDLWFGSAQQHWTEAIYPTLTEVLDGGLIAREDFVRKMVKVAYLMARAETGEEFHLNLRDIDGVLDEGFLIRGAYGMENPGQVPELILNTGRHYWVPLLSPYATDETVRQFNAVVRPGEIATPEGWTDLLNRNYDPDGEGTAFMCRVGRGVFVMNTRENWPEVQTYRVADVPAPVRAIEASTTPTGVELSWPFREGDVAYKVYKRVLPASHWTRLADNVDQRRYVDPEIDPDATVAYAVTALTNEREICEGALQYGQYRVFNLVESRVAEEAVISPLLGFATSKPVAELPPPVTTIPQEPNLDGVPEEARALAVALVERIGVWDRGFGTEDLAVLLDLYATDYEDPQGWRFQYVRRAYQWFFERYDRCMMAYQIRRWDFRSYEASHQVDVLLYCRFEGIARTDPTGRFADRAAFFPRTQEGEIWVTFTDKEGPWRILRTNPALPNFRDILSFSAGPDNNFMPGPDM